MKKIIILGLLFALCNPLVMAQPPAVPKDGNIYVNAALGADTNNGTKESPLKSLTEAAKRVNASEGEGAITIYLLPGVYGLTETADFNPAKWNFSASGRKASVVELDGENVLKVERDLDKLPFDVKKLETTVDEPTLSIRASDSPQRTNDGVSAFGRSEAAAGEIVLGSACKSLIFAK